MHTPGPWQIKPTVTPGVLIQEAAKPHRSVVHMPDLWNGLAMANNADNARLIAASPLMLEALEAIVESQPHFQKPGSAHKPGSDVWKAYEAGLKAREAIKKAKGS